VAPAVPAVRRHAGHRARPPRIPHQRRTQFRWHRPSGDHGASGAEAVADAELGILLRLTSYASDRAAIRFELREVTRPAAQDPADFRIEDPGVPTVEGSGNPLEEMDVPEPVKRAVNAAHEAARHASAGVTAVTSFLDAMRGKNSRRPR
jgi:hypothetical protein